MRITRGQQLFVAVAAAINLALWIVPSNLVELVARDRHTLLGRYSREHFAWMLALLPISLVACWLHLSPDRTVKKRRAFKLLAALLVLVPSLLAVDIYLRATKSWNYVLGDLAYHRPPNWKLTGVFEDKPEAARTYPHAPPGFGAVPYSITTDHRGFRNLADRDRCDVVALGDSFTEGSKVSDEQVWPHRLEALTGRTVSNLGCSGYAPQHSLAALREYGLAMQPGNVLLLVYEGNDFRSAKPLKKAPAEWSRFFKRSPIVEAVDQFLIANLGPIGATRSLPALDVLSWQPIAYPPGDKAHYYAFPPSFLEHAYMSQAEFESSKYWDRTRAIFEEIRTVCAAHAARLSIVFAPSKPHVVMPLVWDSLPADQVRAFTAIRNKVALPDARTFMTELRAGLDAKEETLAEWCAASDVTMISLTEPMREAVAAGRQVYYTYDEHWTPEGHALAAEVIAQLLADRTSAPGPAPAPASAPTP